jgi:E1A/CREB-binding protein
MSTLKQRLQRIAEEVSRKARNQNDPQPSSSRDYDNRPAMSRRPESGPPGGSISPFGGASGNAGNRMVEMNDINPMASSGRPNGAMNYSNNSLSMPSDNRQMPPDNRGGNGGGGGGNNAVAPSAGSNNMNRNDPEWKIRVRHKQQRLLLLHHSAKCSAEDGRCTVTPHCSDMKRLWRHMEGCRDNSCRVAHCFSSRAILSHYRKCREPSCPICGPVRETVRRSRASGSSSGPSSGHNQGGLMNSSMHALDTSMNSRTLMDPMSTSNNGNYNPANGIGGNGYQNPAPSLPSRPNMPPPPANSNSQGYQSSSSQYRQSSTGPGPSSVQPLYGSDRTDTRGPSSSSSGAHQQDPTSTIPSSSRPSASATGSTSGGGGAAPSSSGGTGSGGRNDSEWQKIRHKQQRLLLLRHASRCQHEAGSCPVTPHCASMKKLWEHIAHCRDPQCTVQHCLSSRYVLSHYRRCKDARCPACGPVRETIRNSQKHEREKGQPPASSSSNPTGTQSFDTSMNHDQSMLQSTSPPKESSPPMEREQKRSKVERSNPEVSSFHAPSGPHSVAAPVPAVASSVKKAEPAQPLSNNSSGKSAKDGKGSSDFSLLESFSVLQLQTHLQSLERKAQLPIAKLKAVCSEVLKGLQTHQHGWVFNCPVDPVELGLPDYFEIVKKPMDLGTIQKKVENGQYHAIDDFQTDVNLSFDNAMLYNEDGSVVYDMAKELKVKFVGDFKKLCAQLDAEDEARRQNDRACTLCGCEKLLFEPPVYFCNGMNCQSQRIRRNSHFYVGGSNQYFWCSSCFNELNEKAPIELVDMTIMKNDLKKKKNDEVHEESWVQCDTCERWVHQICGLFNTRQNKEHHSEYNCPSCLLKKRQAKPAIPKQAPPGAADLPRTALSEWLEQYVTKKVGRRKREIAQEKAKTEVSHLYYLPNFLVGLFLIRFLLQGISLEESTRQVESGGAIIIRQVTSCDRKLDVRDLMRKRYAHKNYPEEFPFRCKCLVVFQELDGVDVVLFALYVYEHDEKNPAPNQRAVYISYLDSVHFMRPRRLRTFVYHEILIAYLDYVRRRGYSTAHIWACPPLKGDDYIFYAKPDDQKTPKDTRLRMWYIEMLIEAQKRSIVGKVTNMYDLYFADEKIDATAVPYFEGDYFPGEAENIIKLLEEGGGKKGGNGGKKKKNKGASKNKGSTGTRSTGVDEEALIASGVFDGAKSFKDLDRDQVMVKLGETILPMKESFIVAFLNWSGAKEEDLVVPESIEKARIEYAAKHGDELAGSKRDAIGNVRDLAPTSSGTNTDGMKIVNDDDEDLDCEFLNNRQAFLNLCRGNHYQFDELRRAKHTSLMVLWHLHNRDAPKFVQQCVSCAREILSGKRYHCNTCPDYDLCQDCYKNPESNRGKCTHTLQPIAVEPASEERSGLSEQERQQRQRNLMLHIQLIEHASRCQSKGCTSTNCAKMKTYLHHARVCRIKVQGGCRICKRIWTLLRIHAQKCKDNKCPIPQCTAIREKMRQLQKQQQAMDDRRRLEMNRHMRTGFASG